MTSEHFPIVIMTRNEGLFLKKTVESILNTVSIPVDIYIVDNSSNNSLHINILRELSEFSNIRIIYNKFNLWVLGVNDTVDYIKSNYDSEYFVLTDGDIDFSDCCADLCWLTYLIRKMDTYSCIGKLGLSLSWDFLLENMDLKEVLIQEKSLYSDRKINDLFVSMVDTTAAIYRFDWSLEGNSHFYPDHIRYLKPGYYSCRTPRSIKVKHLGWYNYNAKSIDVLGLKSKIICFTLIGGNVKDELLNLAPLKYKLFYKICYKPILNLWIVRRYYFLMKYILLKGRRGFMGQG
jgi:glycosyltransferase involved in cell wall biosynthesis